MQLAELPEKKRRMIDAAVRLVLTQGYAGTSVDQICADAGVTKGSFFHYFASKEEICRAAMDAWAGSWLHLLTAAGLERIADPLDRLDRLFEVMVETYTCSEVGPGCMIGTVAQEVAAWNRDLGDPCEAHFQVWTQNVRTLLAEARAAYPPKIDFDPDSVADLMLGLVQGTLLVAKTRQDSAVIRNNVQHCRAYVHSLFGRGSQEP